jgi:hypothetical protein
MARCRLMVRSSAPPARTARALAAPNGKPAGLGAALEAVNGAS